MRFRCVNARLGGSFAARDGGTALLLPAPHAPSRPPCPSLITCALMLFFRLLIMLSIIAFFPLLTFHHSASSSFFPVLVRSLHSHPSLPFLPTFPSFRDLSTLSHQILSPTLLFCSILLLSFSSYPFFLFSHKRLSPFHLAF